MTARLQKLISIFESQNIDCLLVTKDVNIQYLMDFPASESWLLVCPKKIFYITDFRYILEAQRGLKGKGVEIKRYEVSHGKTVFDLAAQAKIKTLGFDSRHLSLAQYQALAKVCPKNIKLKVANNLIESLREVKDDKEMTQIKKALALHKKAYEFIKGLIKPGLTEKEVFWEFEKFVKERGAGFSFSPIIASGPNSCYPHARATDRKIQNNEPVLFDTGIDLNSYKSDLTRIFFLGKMAPLVKEIDTKVREAQRRAIKKIRAGVEISEVDFAARNYLATNGLDKYFGHALGHGVGLEIHESPRLSKENKDVLKEGMIITVEPAVYIPNKFGIRIEDMVLVTKNGCEVLSDHIN